METSRGDITDQLRRNNSYPSEGQTQRLCELFAEHRIDLAEQIQAIEGLLDVVPENVGAALGMVQRFLETAAAHLGTAMVAAKAGR